MRLAAVDLGLALGVHRTRVTIAGVGHWCAGLAHGAHRTRRPIAALGTGSAGLAHAVMPGAVDVLAGVVLHGVEPAPFMGAEIPVGAHPALGAADMALFGPQPLGLIGSQRTIAPSLAEAFCLVPLPLIDPGTGSLRSRRRRGIT